MAEQICKLTQNWEYPEFCEANATRKMIYRFSGFTDVNPKVCLSARN